MYVLLVLKHEANKELLLGVPLLDCSQALLNFKLVFEYDTLPHTVTPLLDLTNTCKSCMAVMYQSNRSFNILPGQPPGHLNFWKIHPSPGRKAVQMPPPSGELPDYCFNFSVASIMLLKLCM